MAHILIDDLPTTDSTDVVPVDVSANGVDTPMDLDQANAPAVEFKAAAVEKDIEMVLADADTSKDTESPSALTEPPSNSKSTLPDNHAFTFVPKQAQTQAPLNPFSRSGIPKLQENIPAEYFPDTLIVHDPSGASMACDDREYRYGSSTPDVADDEGGKTLSDEGQGRTAFVYKRVYPVPAHVASKDDTQDGSTSSTSACSAPSEDHKTAHLYLRPSHRIGVGHHSHVYLSPLTLPSPLTTYTSSSSRPGTVLVAAKLAIQQRNARKLLDAEAATYNEFPPHMSDEYCGVHLLSPFVRTLVPSAALVPKFFGYYVPVYEEGDKRSDKGKLRYPWQKRSPILLMEDCGKPIAAEDLDRLQRYACLHCSLPSFRETDYDRVLIRTDCYALIVRLQMEQYLHGSFHERNIVVQPGPLTLPPMMRSMDTPSFRVIDFGRTINWNQWLKAERDSHLAKHKKETEEKEKSGGGKGKEKEKEPLQRNTWEWWEDRKVSMTEEEALCMDLDSNPYWRQFEGHMAMEWRDARKELGFNPVDAI